MEQNIKKLQEYESKSARAIALKKSNTMCKEEITSYLYKKGYMEETIKGAFNEQSNIRNN